MNCCPMGTHLCTLPLPAPRWSSKTHISVDRCLAGEILMLWGKGIITTGCCCGHGDASTSYIGVDESNIDKMLAMGYIIYPNSLYPDRRDSFYSKTFSKLYKEKLDG